MYTNHETAIKRVKGKFESPASGKHRALKSLFSLFILCLIDTI